MSRHKFSKAKLIDRLVDSTVASLKNKLYRQYRYEILKEDRRQVVDEAIVTYDMIMPRRLCE